MSALIVIPARFASTRYPGKPLAALRGATGQAKSLIERTWEAAQAVPGIARVVIATDDMRIRMAVEAFGAEVVMTDPSCANGTERCAEAYAGLAETFEIVVNLQGDAPLTPPWFIETLIDGLHATPLAQAATPVLRCDGRALQSLRNDRQKGRVGGTTAVFDRHHMALYFSKEVIPFSPEHPLPQEALPQAATPVFHHVGVYAYRPKALLAYAQWPAGPLEKLEGLEQLRFLENGQPILCVEVEARGRDFWELNNPEDVSRLEAMMTRMEIV